MVTAQCFLFILIQGAHPLAQWWELISKLNSSLYILPVLKLKIKKLKKKKKKKKNYVTWKSQ